MGVVRRVGLATTVAMVCAGAWGGGAVAAAGGSDEPHLQRVPVGADGTIAPGVSEEWPVVVIGGGLAGLSAALEARRSSDARVVLVEAASDLGGNSAKASSGMNWLAPDAGDDEALFVGDTVRSGGGLSDEALVRKLVAESPSARSFLEEHGVTLAKRSQCGAHSVARTHRNEPPGPNVGAVIVRALGAAARADAGIDVRVGTRARALLTELAGVPCAAAADASARVCAVALRSAGGEEVVQPARAVVLATGGFAASAAHLERWAPELAALPTTNGPTASGDGIELGAAAGAALVHMAQVQVHPTALVNGSEPEARTKWLAPEALRGAGGVLLDARGARFVDELATRAAVTAAMRALPGARATLVLGAAAARSFGLGTLGFYAAKGLATELRGLGALAAHLRVPASELEAELGAYDALAARAAAGEAVRCPHGKTVFPAPVLGAGPAAGAEEAEDGPFYAMEVTPALHYCMGGVRIGAGAQVLAEPTGAPIGGLYGAGEVTGGVHGANRLAGNSLLECVVFGRTAGRAAALEPQPAPRAPPV